MELLRTGSTGNIVTYLQKCLNIPQSGTFDTATETAVNSFQQQHGLKVDGLVGGDTWVQLYLVNEKPRNAVSKTDRHNNILHLHPVVRKAAVKVFVQLQAEGIPFKIFEAFRYPQRQADLYAQGRTKPGNIVTYAKPWSSYHQYGLAIDFVLLIDGEWSWSSNGQKAQWWALMHRLGEQEKLMRLNFEIPHLQLTGTSSSALKSGVYPPGGDESWYQNFMAARS